MSARMTNPAGILPEATSAIQGGQGSPRSRGTPQDGPRGPKGQPASAGW